MESLFVGLHIIFGIIAIISAPIAIFYRHQRSTHRLFGQIYAVSMYLSLTVAMVIAIQKTLVFLLLIGLFSLFLLISGHRYAITKSRFSLFDKIFSISALFLAILSALFGLFWFTGEFSILLLVFSGIWIYLCINLMHTVFKTTQLKEWKPSHLSAMMASYISALTAVSVVNLTIFPQLISWLWPTVVMVPLIRLLIRSEKRKATQ